MRCTKKENKPCMKCTINCCPYSVNLAYYLKLFKLDSSSVYAFNRLVTPPPRTTVKTAGYTACLIMAILMHTMKYMVRHLFYTCDQPYTGMGTMHCLQVHKDTTHSLLVTPGQGLHLGSSFISL